MRLIFCLLLFVFCIGSNSCQKEFSIDDGDSTAVIPPGTPDPNVNGSFTAKINGVNFSADSFSFADIANDVIAIVGKDNNGQTILLRVADSGVHEYTMDIESNTNAGAYTKGSDIAYSTNGGNTNEESGGMLTITEINTANKTVSGTFSMKVYRAIDLQQLNITDGVFKNISYSTDPAPPAASTDSFRVKIDGIDLPVYSVFATPYLQTLNASASDQQLSKTVGLSFPLQVTPGTYDFTAFDFNYIGQYNVDGAFETADSGTLVILENNATTKRVRGTFKFHAAELLGSGSAELTEGYFSVGY